MSLGTRRHEKIGFTAGSVLSAVVLFVVVVLVLVLPGTHARGQEVVAPDPPFVRYDISSAKGAAQIPSLQKGTLAMMQLDCKDKKTAPACESEAAVEAGKAVQTGVKADGALSPLGWKYQASIHGSLPGAIKQTGWNTCQHSTWFFLSWHRMELYYFERILRKMSGDPKFTLPYWDFSVPAKGAGGPDGYGARMPASYRLRKLADGSDNPLFWPYRNSRLNMAPPAAGADPAWPVCGIVVATKDAFAQTAFFTNTVQKGGMSFGGGAEFSTNSALTHPPGLIGSGQIEEVPHNQLHGTIGAGLPGLPGSPNATLSLLNAAGAGLDPIFWPFHVNIDRAWACWQQKHKGSEPKSDEWLQRKFTFYDVQDAAPGYKEVTMTGAQVISTAALMQPYEYDNACQNFDLPPSSKEVTDAADDSGVVKDTEAALTATGQYDGILGAEPVTVTIKLPSSVQMRLLALLAANAPRGSILLTIGGLAVDQPSGASYGIYLNLPEGAAPNYKSASYVSELGFFGIGHNMHLDYEAGQASGGSSISYDVTDVVRRLVATGDWPGNRLTVTLAHADAVPADCVQPETASPAVRARFTDVTLTVE